MTRHGLVRSSSRLCSLSSVRQRLQTIPSLPLLGAALLLFAPDAQAQSTQDLQQQIQQMKQLYEQQISALEGRIASLEQANRAVAHVTQENTVSVTDLQSEVEKTVTAHEEPKLSRAQRTEIEQTELGEHSALRRRRGL